MTVSFIADPTILGKLITTLAIHSRNLRLKSPHINYETNSIAQILYSLSYLFYKMPYKFGSFLAILQNIHWHRKIAGNWAKMAGKKWLSIQYATASFTNSSHIFPIIQALLFHECITICTFNIFLNHKNEIDFTNCIYLILLTLLHITIFF